mgnify:CR=1 FL=1
MPRSEVWRGLARLLAVGRRLPGARSACMSRAHCLRVMRDVCGGCALTEAELAEATSHCDAIAKIITKYTGRPTTEADAAMMFSNKEHRGYRHTEEFGRALGGLPWPPGDPLLPEPPPPRWDDAADDRVDPPATREPPGAPAGGAGREDVGRLMTWEELEPLLPW